MDILEHIKESMHNYEKENGKMPKTISISEEAFREIFGSLPVSKDLPNGKRRVICGVPCEVSGDLVGRTYVFDYVSKVPERPDKEVVYHWVGVCLGTGSCVDDGKGCPYARPGRMPGDCRRRLANDFSFYGWGELLKEKKGTKK